MAGWKAMVLPSGDQRGFAVGPVLVTSVRTLPSATAHHRDVGGRPVARVVVHAVVEGDLPAVGRPGEAADRERALGQPPRLPRVEVDQPQVSHDRIEVHELELAVLLVPVLDRLWLRVGCGEGDRLPVGRPGERRDALLGGGDGLGLAAPDVNPVDLLLARAVRQEAERPSVSGPGGRVARALRVGQLPRRAGGHLRQPDLGLVGVLVPVRFAHGIGHQPAVRRDGWRADPPERE